jgi:hypothetical protein
MADDLKNVLMVSPDGEMAQVPPEMVETARKAGARVISHNSRLLAKYADTIPAIAGFAGGAMGLAAGGGTTAGVAALPGMALGSAAGGAVGEGLRLGVRHALGYPDPTVPEVAGQVLHEGGLQGMLGIAGEVPALAVRAVGRGLLTSAGKPATEASLMAMEKGRVPVGRPMTPWGKTGAEQIAANVERPAAARNALLASADASGVTINRDALMQRAFDLAAETDKELGSTLASSRIAKANDIFRSKYPDELTPSQVQEIKRIADDIFYNVSKRMKINPTTGGEAYRAWNEAVGNDARSALSNLPGVGADISRYNAEMAPQLGLLNDIRAAEGMNPRLGSAPAPRPLQLGGIKGMDVGMAAMGGSGRVASRAGLLLTHPVFQTLLMNSPRAAMEFLRSHGAEPDVLSNPNGGTR